MKKQIVLGVFISFTLYNSNFGDALSEYGKNCNNQDQYYCYNACIQADSKDPNNRFNPCNPKGEWKDGEENCVGIYKDPNSTARKICCLKACGVWGVPCSYNNIGMTCGCDGDGNIGRCKQNLTPVYGDDDSTDISYSCPCN